jgi:putative cardiolipin synthase
VFDDRRFFVGSWNYDQRSLRINTEIGLLIDSPELANQVAQRFRSMTAPAAAYRVVLHQSADGRKSLTWDTEIDHQNVELTKEPSRGWWQRSRERVLSLLPLQPEL